MFLTPAIRSGCRAICCGERRNVALPRQSAHLGVPKPPSCLMLGCRLTYISPSPQRCLMTLRPSKITGQLTIGLSLEQHVKMAYSLLALQQQ